GDGDGNAAVATISPTDTFITKPGTNTAVVDNNNTGRGASPGKRRKLSEPHDNPARNSDISAETTAAASEPKSTFSFDRALKLSKKVREPRRAARRWTDEETDMLIRGCTKVSCLYCHCVSTQLITCCAAY